MIRFIHTADIHFGMENYGRIDATTGIHSRLLDFNKALNFCIDKGIENGIDFFLFSGDAYKTANPSPTQQQLLMRSLLRLHDAGIPVIIIIGNHDNPLSFGKANALAVFGDIPLDNFYVIAKPTIIRLTTKSGPIQIVGIPWPTRNSIATAQQHLFKTANEITTYLSHAIRNIIKNYAQQLDASIPCVLAGHLTVSSGVFSGSEKRAIYGNDPLFLPSDLAIAPFDYVALGHLHRHQDLNPHGYPHVVYSGSIERVDFGERKEDKGFCLVTIEEKNKTSYEFITTPMRPFVQIELMLNSTEDHTSQLVREIKKHQLTDAVVKIIYHVPSGKKDRVDLAAIQEACAKAWYIVGIIPVHAPETRTLRTSLALEMDTETLLRNYFADKPEWSAHSESLIKTANELEAELEKQNDDDDEH